MPLIKGGAFVPDTFRTLTSDEPITDGAPVVVSLARWQAERDRLMARNAPLGLRLKSNELPTALGSDVQHFALIAIEFPSFRDGRGFSSARRLRGELGFRGELRAVGHLLPDQAQFLARCGFDSFEVKEGTRLSDWQRGLTEISVFYQPAGDRRATALLLRRRQAAE